MALKSLMTDTGLRIHKPKIVYSVLSTDQLFIPRSGKYCKLSWYFKDIQKDHCSANLKNVCYATSDIHSTDRSDPRTGDDTLFRNNLSKYKFRLIPIKNDHVVKHKKNLENIID